MRLLQIQGGIRYVNEKDCLQTSTIRQYLPKGKMTYPLLSYGQTPAEAVVSVGQNVLAGEKIAETKDKTGLPVYATVSGVVTSVEDTITVNGSLVSAISIANDTEYREVIFSQKKPVEIMFREEILSIIREAGILDCGEKQIPAYAKLTMDDANRIHTVLVNCMDDEPYLTGKYRSTKEETEALIKGMEIILRLFPKAIGVFALDEKKEDIIKAVHKFTTKADRMSFVAVKNKYPMDKDTLLLANVFGKKMSGAKKDIDSKCMVLQSDTVIAIYYALTEGKPILHQVVTVGGEGIVKPCNYLVPFGTSYEELFKEAGVIKKKAVKVIAGGPMRGSIIKEVDFPVLQGTSGLMILDKEAISAHEATACIKCGRCLKVCPIGLVPVNLAKFSEKDSDKMFKQQGGLDCILCGCCSYVCPAKRELTQLIFDMQSTILYGKNEGEDISEASDITVAFEEEIDVAFVEDDSEEAVKAASVEGDDAEESVKAASVEDDDTEEAVKVASVEDDDIVFVDLDDVSTDEKEPVLVKQDTQEAEGLETSYQDLQDEADRRLAKKRNKKAKRK